MKNKLLFLVHRLPYPPNKGDKIASFNLLRFLAERYDVFVGTFIDDHYARAPEDLCGDGVDPLDPQNGFPSPCP